MTINDSRSFAAASVSTDLLTQINARLVEFRSIAAKIAAGNELNESFIGQSALIKAEVEALKLEISAIIAANIPGHEWAGTTLRLMNPDGEWGDFISLKGEMGPQGQVGPKGEIGNTGPKGDQGLQGDTGAQGEKGDKGDTGDKGDSFTVNAQGTLANRASHDGEVEGFSYLDIENGNLYFRTAVAGAWSAPIPFGKGETGEKGDKGDAGIAGPEGPSAYDVAVEAGFSGSEALWLASLRGAKGDKGDTGSQGIQGIQGLKGDTGAKGDQGIQGTQGVQGIQGLPGPKGDTGAKGDKGDTGATGEAGPAGTTDYNALSNKPTLGTAAAKDEAFFVSSLHINWGIIHENTEPWLNFLRNNGHARPRKIITNAVDDCIAEMSDCGAWDITDIFNVFFLHDLAASLVGLKNPGWLTWTPTNSPVFEPGVGFSSTGVSTTGGYLRANRAPNALTHFTQDAAAAGIYVTGGGSETGDNELSTSGGASASGLGINSYASATSQSIRVNNTAGWVVSGITGPDGFAMGVREGANLLKGYRDGVLLGTTTAFPSMARASTDITFLASGSGRSEDFGHAAIMGGAYTADMVAGIQSALSTLRSTIGVF